MRQTNIGNPLTKNIQQFRSIDTAGFANNLFAEFYEHYLNLKTSAEWLDANDCRDLASIFRNFADDVSRFCGGVSGREKMKFYQKEEKGFALITEKTSKSEIVRRILRRNIFETRHLIREIKNKFSRRNANADAEKRVGKILQIYEQQLFWLKIFLKHRSREIV